MIEGIIVVLCTWVALFVIFFFFVGLMTWSEKRGHGDPFERIVDWVSDFWEKRL